MDKRMLEQSHLEGRITFLNVGTKILLKDTMDQYLRTLGDFKTHFAPSFQSALRAFAENPIHVLITEVDLGDASAFRLIHDLGGIGQGEDDLYVILALEERSDALMALAGEMEAHSVLIKPFSAVDLKAQIERYKAWRLMPKEPWQLLIREGHLALREKKFREAEEHFKVAVTCAANNPIPAYKVGLYYLKKPDYVIAEGLLRKAITIRPDYVQAISALGSLYLSRGDMIKAEEYLSKAQELSPLNPDRMVELARLYLQRCIDVCKGALRVDPSSGSARLNLGKLMALQRDYIGAVRELEKVVPVLKDDARAEAQTFIALARKLGALKK